MSKHPLHFMISFDELADAHGTMVITFGEDNSKKDIDTFLLVLKTAVDTIREISPLYHK